MLIFFLGGTDSFVAMMERRACVIWMLLGLFLREAAAQDLAPEEGKTQRRVRHMTDYYSQRIEDCFNPSNVTTKIVDAFFYNQIKNISLKKKKKKRKR